MGGRVSDLGIRSALRLGSIGDREPWWMLTLALDRYDRHMPFFDGTVRQPEGFTLRPLQVGQSHPLAGGVDRHGGMLQGKYDIAEFSMSTFLMAIDRKRPIIGIPVFPAPAVQRRPVVVREDSPFHQAVGLAGQTRRDSLVPDDALAAGQGRSEIRIRHAVGGHPLAARRRRNSRSPPRPLLGSKSCPGARTSAICCVTAAATPSSSRIHAVNHGGQSRSAQVSLLTPMPRSCAISRNTAGGRSCTSWRSVRKLPTRTRRYAAA